MDKTEILSMLEQNKSDNGTAQFTFSSDLSVKKTELEILKELENEGYIQKLTVSLGYAVYQVF